MLELTNAVDSKPVQQIPAKLAALPYGRHWIDEDDIAAVMRVMNSEFLTCGPEIEAFEKEFAMRVGAKHAVAVCNATAALHLAMVVSGIKPGDRVVTSPNTFLASANCAAFVGAIPDFVDIDPVTYNLDPKCLERTWQPDTKAVVAVDYAGQSADMPEIARIARKRGAVVIEDACHAAGGTFIHDGRVWNIGGHPWADMTVFSFHPVKTMTAGEGGLLVTDNADYADRARQLRTHGMVRNRAKFIDADPDDCPLLAERGPWFYEMQQLGFNYRITDIQGALARSQLRKLNAFIQRRREIVARYNEVLSKLPWIQTPRLRNPEDRDHISWHLYTVQMDFEAIGKTRTDTIIELERDWVVGCQVLYIPVHLQPWYRSTYGYRQGKCPIAEAYYERALSLPLYPAMNDGDQSRVIAAITSLAMS